MANDTRRNALQILNALESTDSTLDRVLEDVLARQPLSSRRDTALLHAIVFGVLRWRARLDHIIACFSRTPFRRIEPGILNVLRIGIFQIIYLDRVPDSAAVNTSVDLAKSIAPPWLSKFVNAILRKAAAAHHTVPFPDPRADPVAGLAVGEAFPRWLVRRWIKRWGPDETARLCRAANRIPPITLRANSLKVQRRALMEALEADARNSSPTPFAADGVRVARFLTAIADVGAFKRGWFQVQDEAAQLVGLLMNPRPGETILDACAGLGGKTGHIAQLMQNRGGIMAVDHSPDKLNRLSGEMRRLGIGMVNTRVWDLNRPLKGSSGSDFGRDVDRGFDRVLLDAPCSGLGVLRRNPDTKWRAAEEKLPKYHRRQLKFLTRLAPVVRTGGILVYAVCSLEAEENEAVVDAFLRKHPGFALDPPPTGFPTAVPPLADERGCFKTRPHRHDMDGFFAARLRRVV